MYYGCCVTDALGGRVRCLCSVALAARLPGFEHEVTMNRWLTVHVAYLLVRVLAAHPIGMCLPPLALCIAVLSVNGCWTIDGHELIINLQNAMFVCFVGYLVWMKFQKLYVKQFNTILLKVHVRIGRGIQLSHFLSLYRMKRCHVEIYMCILSYWLHIQIIYMSITPFAYKATTSASTKTAFNL